MNEMRKDGKIMTWSKEKQDGREDASNNDPSEEEEIETNAVLALCRH